MQQEDAALVARCGLFCGECRAYRRGKCPGCAGNEKATWCKVRSCCNDAGRASCAECAEYSEPMQCGKFNNFISRLFGLVFRSDRAACIDQIKREGLAGHARLMRECGRQTLRKK